MLSYIQDDFALFHGNIRRATLMSPRPRPIYSRQTDPLGFSTNAILALLSSLGGSPLDNNGRLEPYRTELR